METDISKANPQSFISATENLYWGAFDSDWGKGCVGGVSKQKHILPVVVVAGKGPSLFG